MFLLPCGKAKSCVVCLNMAQGITILLHASTSCCQDASWSFLAKFGAAALYWEKNTFLPMNSWSARCLWGTEVGFFAAASADMGYTAMPCAVRKQNKYRSLPVQSAVHWTSRFVYGLPGCFHQHHHSSGLHISVCDAFSRTINHHTCASFLVPCSQ